MKTKSEQKNIISPSRNAERGNVLVYVLIAIVLFAALSFTLSRQTDTSEAGSLDSERARLYATELITYAANAKSAYDKMEFSGARLENIDFILPSDAAFNTAPSINKIFHPDGGGLNRLNLPNNVAAAGVSDPVPGWYMGRFNNVEWTGSVVANTDIILTAYGISEPICAAVNEQILGNPAIPVMSDSVKETLVPKTIGAVTIFATGTNVDLTTDPAGTPICPDCHNRASLCVQEGGIYGFYTVIADR